MLTARWPIGLIAGFIGVSILAGALHAATQAPARVDAVRTGSIEPTAATTSAPTASVAVPAPARAADIAARPATIVADLGPEIAARPKLTPVNVRVPTLPEIGRQVGPEPSQGFLAALELFTADDEAESFRLAAILGDPAERRALQWASIYYAPGKVSRPDVERFIADAPDFVSGTVFKTRREQALLKEKPDTATIIAELGGAMPETVWGQIRLAESYVADGQTERAARIARVIWVDNFLDTSTEKLVRERLGSLLTSADHWQRASHLMMHDRATAAERLLDFLTPEQKGLVKARNAVSRNRKDAKELLDAVDPSMQDEPVYLFSRAQRARQAGLWDDAIAFLDKADGGVPDGAEFWYERRTMIRQLLALGEVKRAYAAADGYRNGPEGRQVEAHFQAGWIALAFLKDAEAAEPHFEAMRALSTLPDSITQASYWLGQSRMALGDVEGAAEAYRDAAEFRTVYYGQLARVALGLAPTELKDMPSEQDVADQFNAREPVQAVRLFAKGGRPDVGLRLLRNFAFELTDGGELLLAARLAQSLGAHDLAISIADTAEQRGTPLDLFNFPKSGLPVTRLASIDAAAVYAVARQESRFRIDAVSSAGARGLMQLMPGTAKETAGWLGLDYSKSRLTSDPEYNALLGSTYLKAQLDRFDGSLLLAAAAYNAGGGNVNKWIRLFGDPRSESIDPVVWVELIPYDETRKYVQRVLGNYTVYRARLGKEPPSPVEALRRLPG